MSRNAEVLSLHVLGSGGSASHVYDGECSASMVICRDGQPVLLIELGPGTTHECLRRFGILPGHIIISHNHTDHAGELPVVLRVECKAGRRLHIHAEQEVVRRLKTHRMAEHHDIVAPDELAVWHPVAAGATGALFDDLSLEFIRGVHSEYSCGMLLKRDGKPLLGYSGDSAFSEQLYDRLREAPLVIYDARPGLSRWHASFEQVRGILRPGDAVIGHGVHREDAPEGMPLLFASDVLALGGD